MSMAMESKILDIICISQSTCSQFQSEFYPTTIKYVKQLMKLPFF
uniref:Uncharacterized protein n=1 Tax=Rhizophora mucronata TaxID=61149 RepID=A0A2P2QU70_RHIMU